MTIPFFCLLTHESIISIEGIDSKKFLQGQTTCNLNYLSTELTSLGACCTPKGRMISSFRIIEKASSHYLLILDKYLIEKQLSDLKKYAVFSKITFEQASQQWIRFGLHATPESLSFLNLMIPQQTNHVTQTADFLLINIGKNLFEFWVLSSQAEQTTEQLAKHFQEKTMNEWLLVQIQAGIGQIFLENTERFVPQMINLQSVGGVSFKKGCYLGQEIIARMQYLGKLKQHLYRFTTTTQDLPIKGTEIFSTVHNTSVGEVILAARTPDNTIELLATVRDDAAIAKLWLKEDQDHPLELLSLPYEINPEEEIKQ